MFGPGCKVLFIRRMRGENHIEEKETDPHDRRGRVFSEHLSHLTRERKDLPQ